MSILLIPVLALAVAPPRPGGEVELPPALARWPQPRPGLAREGVAKAAAAASTGLHRLPVLPGGFADRPGSVPVAGLQAVFTGAGSVRDYFLETSGGRLEVTGEVAGWRRAPQDLSYYAGSDNGLDLWGAPHNAGRFVLDVVQLADAAGLDWGRYDNDGPDGLPNSGDDDGVVDCAVILHAAEGGECGTGQLWSHQFFLGGWGYGAYTTRTRRSGGGYITVDDYLLVPERSCRGGTIEIGVICHEYGHVLGLPDLYDTQGGAAGIGGWGLMGTGGWGGDGLHPEQPSWPSAWSRRDLGWCAESAVLQDGTVSLPAAGSEDRVLVVRDATMPGGEFFLLENRLRRGFDRSLPGEGLLIWHVDETVLAATRALNEVNAGAVYGVALEQADGANQLALAGGGNNGDAGDPWPGTAGALRFAAGTAPSSATNAGQRTDVVVRAILTPRDPASFHVAMGVTELDLTPPAVQVLLPGGGEDWTLGDVVTVVWSASDASGVAAIELRLDLDGEQSFERVLATGLANTGSWSGSLGATPGEAVRLQVRAFDPEGNLGLAQSGPFALRDRYAPGVAVSGLPAAGAQLRPGETVALAWQTADNVGVEAVDLELSCDGGATWSPTDLSDLPAVGEAIWTVPDLPCALARLRAVASDAADNRGSDVSAVFAILGSTTGVPDARRLALGPCIPNPFNPRAEIGFSLPHAGHLRLSVHDARGRRLRRLVDATRPAGRQSVIWNGRDEQGRDVPSGVYWVRAEGPGGAAILAVTLVR